MTKLEKQRWLESYDEAIAEMRVKLDLSRIRARAIENTLDVLLKKRTEIARKGTEGA